MTPNDLAYPITITRLYTDEDWPDKMDILDDWCRQHVGRYGVDWSASATTYRFRTAEIACLFVVTWG